MWIAILKDGTSITQKQYEPKTYSDLRHLVCKLGYEYNGTTIWLPNNLIDYRYGGSVSSSLGGKTNVDSYWIQGTFQSDFKKIRLRFYTDKHKIDVEASHING